MKFENPPSMLLRIIVPVSVIQTCMWGLLYYTYAVLIGPVGQDIGVGVKELTGLFTVAMLISGLVGIPIGRFADANGGKIPLIGGCLLASAMFIAWRFATTFLELSLIWCGIGFSMALIFQMGNIIFVQAIPAYFQRAVVICSLFTGFAAAIFVPMTEYSYHRYGLHLTLEAFAVICILCSAIGFLIIPNSTSDINSGRKKYMPDIVAKHSVIGRAIRSARFWAVAIALGSNGAISTILAVHLVSILDTKGYQASEIATAIAIGGPSQIGVRVLLAFFYGRYSSSLMLGLMALTLQLVAMILLTISDASASFAWAAFAFGITNGIAGGLMLIVGALVTTDIFGMNDYGQIQGILKMITTISRAIAPSAVALAFYTINLYQQISNALIYVAIISIAAFVFSLSPKKALSNISQ